MAVDPEMARSVLELIPQQPPFRFVDSITHLDETGVMGDHRFSEDAFFYKGHFPGNPITPGVILTEAMAQIGVVALGIFLMICQGMDIAHIRRRLFMFAYAQELVFERILRPGEKALIQGEKIYFRRNQLKSKVTLLNEAGEKVCSGILAGRGIAHHEA